MLCHAPAKPYRWRLLSMCRAGFSSLLLLVPARLRSARSYIPLERLVGEIEAMLAGRLPPGYTWTARTQTCSPSSLPPPTLWSLASARRTPRSRLGIRWAVGGCPGTGYARVYGRGEVPGQDKDDSRLSQLVALPENHLVRHDVAGIYFYGHRAVSCHAWNMS